MLPSHFLKRKIHFHTLISKKNYIEKLKDKNLIFQFFKIQTAQKKIGFFSYLFYLLCFLESDQDISFPESVFSNLENKQCEKITHVEVKVFSSVLPL